MRTVPATGARREKDKAIGRTRAGLFFRKVVAEGVGGRRRKARDRARRESFDGACADRETAPAPGITAAP